MQNITPTQEELDAARARLRSNMAAELAAARKMLEIVERSAQGPQCEKARALRADSLAHAEVLNAEHQTSKTSYLGWELTNDERRVMRDYAQRQRVLLVEALKHDSLLNLQHLAQNVGAPERVTAYFTAWSIAEHLYPIPEFTEE